MVTGQDIVDAARQILGSPYRWWGGGELELAAPFYMGGAIAAGFDRNFVKREGVNCAGLLNWARAECGLDPLGGTGVFPDFLSERQLFDPTTPGVPGAVAIHPYEGGMGFPAEGHVVLYSGEHSVIQSDAGRGVNEDDQDYEAHEWSDFVYYGLMPDVYYSDHSDGQGNL